MAKTFYIGKSKLEISNELEEYNDFRNSFVPLADEAVRKFEEQYKAENHSLGGLVKNFDKQVMNAINPVMLQCSKLLFEKGIYDVDKDTFLNQYCAKYITVVDSFQKFVDKYYEIQGDKEATKMYRDQRKASRGMLIGGGFGLEGAAKGIVVAGAFNMASGLMHSIGNGIANMFSNMECRKKMDAVFYNCHTLEELKDAVWESAFNMHYAYLDVLEERNGERINKFEKEAYKKAEAICKNIVNLQPDFESVQPAICQMLLAHPYEFDFYCVIIAQYGDENNQLQKIGEFFHIDIDAIKIYIYDTIIKKIDFKSDNDLEWVLSNAESYGVHFGVKKNVIEETSNRVRNSYNEYKLSKSYYDKRKVYLLEDSNRKQLDETLDSCLYKCKESANNLYDSYLKGCEGSFVPKLIKADPKLNKFKKYLFMIGEDKLNQSFKFKISNSLIEYGRGKCIRISDVHKIKVENSKITVNDVYNYQCSREQKDNNLEKFLSELIKDIQLIYSNSLTTALELGDLFDGRGNEALKKVTTYLDNNKKAIVKLYSDYNVFNELDIDKMIAVNNIAKKLEYYGVDRKQLNPILWFNITHVEKTTDDSVIATEEFNEEKYRVDGDDNVLLTLKYLYFTNSNIKVETKKVSGMYVNGRNIELSVDGTVVQIAASRYSDAKVLKELFENIIKLVKGEQAGNLEYNSSNDTLKESLENCSNKLNQMLLRRTKEDEREKFLQFLAINCENEYFDSELAEYADEYSQIKNIKSEKILFFIRNTEVHSKEAVFLTKDIVVIVWKNNSGEMKVDCSRKFRDVRYITLEPGKIDAVGTHGKKMALCLYFDNERVICYESDFSIEYRRKNVCADIVNEILWTSQEALGLPAKRENINFFDFLLKEYKRCGLNANENKKIVFLKYEASNFEEKLNIAKTNFTGLSEKEEPIFIFDDTMLHSLASGFILTNKHLYHKELPNNKISLNNIEELQFNSGFLTAIVVITTTGERHELSYKTTVEGKNGLFDFLTAAIFYMKDNPDSAAKGKIDKEKELEDKKKSEDELKAFRNLPGVFLDVEKNAVMESKRKCDELGLPSGRQNTLMFKGISDSFDSIYNRMKQSGLYFKIDNIEIPLMLFFKETNYSGGFIITSEALYTCSGVIASAYRIPIKIIDKIDIEEGIKNSSIFVKTIKDYETNNLCKVLIEDAGKYRTVIKLLVSELTKVIDIIHSNMEQLYEKIEKYREEYKTIATMTIDQLNILSKNLIEFPVIFSNEITVIKNTRETFEFEKYLNNSCANLEEMKKSVIKKLLSEIKQKDLHTEVISTFKDELNRKFNLIEEKELKEICKDITAMNKSELQKLLSQIQDNYSFSTTRNDYISSINTRISEIDKAVIDSMCEGIDTLSREECILLKNKLNEYDERLTKKYLTKINSIIEVHEKAVLDEMCLGYEAMDKTQLKELRKEVCNLGFDKENIRSYLGNIFQKIVEYDNRIVSDLCNDITKLNYEDGHKLLLQVQSMDLAEEVKAAFLEKLDTQLIEFKRAEMEKYIKGITALGVFSDNLGIPGRASTFFNNKYQNARNRYAREISKYEIPVLIHDTSVQGNGDEGFVITNESLYLSNKMPRESKIALDSILSFEIERKLLSTSINLVLKNGIIVTVPNKISKGILPRLLSALNQMLYERSTYISNINSSIPRAEYNQSIPQSEYNQRPQMDHTSGQPKCGKCGSTYTMGQRFCGVCGNNLELQTVKTTLVAAPATKVNIVEASSNGEVKSDADIWQFCYNELNKSRVNKPIGFVSIPGYMPKFEKKYMNAIKSYAYLIDETPILLFDTTVFESGKEGFILTNKNIHVKYMFEKSYKYPISSIHRFQTYMEGKSLRIGIELNDGTKRFVIGSSTNEAEANDRCNYLNIVLNRIKDSNNCC